MERSNSSKNKFGLVMVAGLAIAAAIGGAFVLGAGSRGEGEAQVALALQATVAAMGTPAGGGAAGVAQGQDGADLASQGEGQAAPETGEQDGGADGADETSSATATATATATPGDGCNFCGGDGEIAAPPTATATPSAGCAFCIDGDIAIEPTKVDPCPLCDHPVIISGEDVTAPEISDIDNVEFCGLTFYVDFMVSEESKVWLTYVYLGVTLSTPVEHVTDDAHLSVDLSGYGWGIYEIDTFRLHAEDYAGNVTHAGPYAMPEVDLGC